MRTLLDLFKTFKSNPNEAMVLFMQGQRSSFSYAELYDHSLRLAGWLKQQGVGKGDKVALWMPGSPLAVVGFWAVLCRGAIVVPVAVGLKAERAEKRIRHTECKLILGGPLKGPDADVAKILPSVSFFGLPKIIESSKLIAPENVQPDDLAEILFTSATTGEAKGVCLSHKNLMANVEMRAGQLPSPKASERSLCLLDFSHGFGQTAGFLAPSLLGGTAVFLPRLDIKNVIHAWADENFSAIMLAPVYLSKLKIFLEKVADKYRPALVAKLSKNFKFFVCVGTALDSRTLVFWEKLNMPVLQGYGMTECFPIAISTLSHLRVGTLGRPVPGVSISFKDGEILVKGENVFKGYWKNSKATAGAFTKGGWFKTGDLGEMQDGYIKLFGRREEAIITSGGQKVFPVSVESVINAIEGVKEACVVGKPDKNGSSLHAVLILNNNNIAGKNIIIKANKKLPKNSQIKSFSLSPADEFPKTATGKIQRFRVAEYVNDYNMREALPPAA